MGAAARTGMLLAAFGLMHAPAAPAVENKNVLVVFSNARLLPANIETERGLREMLAKSANRRVDVFAEFLEVPHFGGEAYNETVAASPWPVGRRAMPLRAQPFGACCSSASFARRT